MPFRAKIVCVNGVYLNFALVLTAVPARFKKRSWNCRYIHPCYNIDYFWQVGSIPNVDSSVLSLASKFGFKFSLWTVNKFTSSYSRVGSIPAQAVCAIPALSPPRLSFLTSASTIQQGWKNNKPSESYSDVSPADPDKSSRWTTATFQSISCLLTRDSLTLQYYASLTCVPKPPNILGVNGL